MGFSGCVEWSLTPRPLLGYEGGMLMGPGECCTEKGDPTETRVLPHQVWTAPGKVGRTVLV